MDPRRATAPVMSNERKSDAAEAREDRLKQALRANLRRRKTQARERRDGDGETGSKTPDGE